LVNLSLPYYRLGSLFSLQTTNYQLINVNYMDDILVDIKGLIEEFGNYWSDSPANKTALEKALCESPHLRARLIKIFDKKEIKLIRGQRTETGGFCLFVQPDGVSNYAIKVEVKLPVIDYDLEAEILPEILQPLSIIHSDNTFHVTTVPYIERFLGGDPKYNKDEAARMLTDMIKSLYSKGWLFWDPHERHIGIIKGEDGADTMVIIDSNSVIKLENANKPCKGGWTYSYEFMDIVRRKKLAIDDGILRQIPSSKPPLQDSPQYWAQLVLYRDRFPNGIEIGSSMPVDKQIAQR